MNNPSATCPTKCFSKIRTYRIHILAAAVLLMVFVATTAEAQNGKLKSNATQAAPTKPLPKFSIDELTKQSEIVAIGTVTGMRSEWTDNKERIQTLVDVSLDQTIKGTTTENSITIVIPGGEVDGVGEWYSHSVQFQKNEDVVVFAHTDKQGQLRVTNGEQGKFRIQKDEKTGSKIIPHLGTLDNFAKQIQRIVKPDATNTKQD